MKKIIYRWYWAWSFDKEEKWLNEMAAKGLCLDSVSFCRYVFKDCEPGEYNIRLQFLKHWPRHPESEAYVSFIEETGAEHIGSVTRWVYFRKKTKDGSFELFSDTATRIRHLQRLQSLCAVLSIANLYNGIYNTFLYLQYHNPWLLIGLFAFFLGLLIGFGFLRISRIRRRLLRDQMLFE